MTSLLNIAGNIPVSAAAEVGQSLRFEDGDSPYLSWTPASAGNRKTWTYSTWIKRANLGGTQLFGINSGDSWMIRFSTSDKIACNFANDTVTNYFADSTRVFRDTSAWYHIVVSCDTTQSTASDRVKIYVNGELETITGGATSIPQNRDTDINVAAQHRIGAEIGNRYYSDGYIANACFIDGQQLDPTSFGEYDGTLWKPKSDADIQSLTFGTNGFYLPFKQTTEAEGFSTVTYTGNGGTQAIEGVGFEPSLVWIKARNFAGHHVLVDSVRGTFSANRYGRLFSNTTSAEDVSSSDTVTSLDADGFGVNSAGSGSYVNDSGDSYVAWCWDAGSGSPVSNTDGDITSTVKANTAKGFSIISWDAQTTGSKTIGHGLSAKPELILIKSRSQVSSLWLVYDKTITATKFLQLHSTAAATTNSTVFDDTEPTNSVFTIGSGYTSGNYGVQQISYAFHSVSGYSSIGSYTGTGAAGNSITGLGFKPSFLMVKRTDSADNWVMFDNTRDPVNSAEKYLLADSSQAEATFSTVKVDFDSDGFTLQGSANSINNSSGTYIYMAIADTRDATFFGDTSGNGNNWTPNKLNNTDVVPDSPVTGGNFAVMNPLNWNVMTFAEGNLKITTTTNFRSVHSTFALPSSGKWIYEFVATDYTSGGGAYIGFSNNMNEGDNEFTGDHGVFYQTYNGGFNVEGTVSTATGYTVQNADFTSDGDIHTIAIDVDNQKLYFAKNGVWRNSADPAAGTGGLDISACFTSPETSLTPCITRGGSYNEIYTFNFGQDSSFAGTKTPQGNTDDNGVGDFYYAPPSGFLALTTGNLPAATITAPDEYFNTVVYTGNGTAIASGGISVTGVNFQPDWVWLKSRTNAYDNMLFDSVRGRLKILKSNSTSAEITTNTENLDSFDADGFTYGSELSGNASGASHVAWNWLASNNTVSNTDGSITSTVSANQTAGFSIVSYTGTGANATVGHGLSSAPEIIIPKNRDYTSGTHWDIYASPIGAGNILRLNSTLASTASATNWNSTAPNSSVFTVGTSNSTNRSGDGYIAYCFHSVEGYSKIGSYTGNGSSDGTFVHCGFRPSFILTKAAIGDTSNWEILDTTRSTNNVADDALLPNSSIAEQTSSTTSFAHTDILSNGFKHRGTSADINKSGVTYIFLAFAEAPFKSANAR